MRIHLLSDLHLEFQDFSPATHDADVVVLAGDIDLLARGVVWANKNFHCPVIYVAGNHEFYKGHLNRTMEKMREKALPHVHVSKNDEVVVYGVRFLGTTGWTDFYSTDNVTAALHTAQISMNDYKQIRMGANYRRIKPVDLQQKSQFRSTGCSRICPPNIKERRLS
jgi:predicted phosphodiesterase